MERTIIRIFCAPWCLFCVLFSVVSEPLVPVWRTRRVDRDPGIFKITSGTRFVILLIARLWACLSYCRCLHLLVDNRNAPNSIDVSSTNGMQNFNRMLCLPSPEVLSHNNCMMWWEAVWYENELEVKALAGVLWCVGQSRVTPPVTPRSSWGGGQTKLCNWLFILDIWLSCFEFLEFFFNCR